MSHFVAVVILPPGTEDANVREVLEDLLEPYCENLEVPEYETECSCVGSTARDEARTKAGAKYSIDRLREELRAEFPGGAFESETAEARWKELLAPLQALEARLEKEHPAYGKPDPECTGCGGTGKRMTTYNPRSQWDWWVIGGRWDGWITGTKVESKDGGYNFGDEHRQLENNAVPVSVLVKRGEKDVASVTPYAIVTPDGAWHARAKMGWWGISRNERDRSAWADEVLAIYREHADRLAVAVDMHI